MSGTGRGAARAERDEEGESQAGGDHLSWMIPWTVATVSTDSIFEDLRRREGDLSRAAMPACDVGDGAHRRLVQVSDAVCIEPRVASTRCLAHVGRASNLAPARSGKRRLPAAVLLPVVMVVVVGLLLPEATVRFCARAPCLCLGLSCCVSSLIFPVCQRESVVYWYSIQ